MAANSLSRSRSPPLRAHTEGNNKARSNIGIKCFVDSQVSLLSLSFEKRTLLRELLREQDQLPGPGPGPDAGAAAGAGSGPGPGPVVADEPAGPTAGQDEPAGPIAGQDEPNEPAGPAEGPN